MNKQHDNALPFLPRLRAVGLLAGLLAALGSAPAAAQEPASEEVTTPAVDPDAPVDLNTATAAELESLPGIGPSRAQAIIAYRENHRFERIEQIMRVRGIGRSTFRQIRERLRVEASSRRRSSMR